MQTKKRRMRVGDGSFVKSVVRAFQILEFISEHEQGVAFNQMVHDLAIPRSSLNGLLNTMLQCEYIQRTVDGRRFQLGSKVLELSHRYVHDKGIIELAKQASKQLSQQTGEATQVMTLDKSEAIIIASQPSAHPMRIEFQPGERRPAHATASGKCLLAYYDDEDIENNLDAELPQLTEKTLGSLEQLKRELQITRDLGYAYDAEESEPGLHCIAAPLFDHTGRPVASISVSIPTARIPAIDIETVPVKIKSLAAQYSQSPQTNRTWEPGALRIAWSMGSLRVQSYRVVYEAVQRYRYEFNADVIWNDAREDPIKQKIDVTQLLSLKPDVLILHAAHTHLAEELFSSASQVGIPTICFQRPVRSKQVEYFIGGDTYEMARMITRYVVEQLNGSGNIVILGGDPYNDNARNISEGIYETLKFHPQIKVLEDHAVRHWSREKAYELVKQICADHGSNVSAIMAANDDMASGVVKALREYHLEGKVVVTGGDGDFPAIQRIINQTQHGTAFQNWAELARETLRFAVEIVENRVDRNQLTRRSILYAPPGPLSLVRDLPYIFVSRENTNLLQDFWSDASQLLGKMPTW